jgi:fatty acid desaturase
MEYLKIMLIGLAVLFIALLLKTGAWRRMPFISTIFSIALFLGAVAVAIFIGSVLIFILLAVVGFFLILFIIFRIFGKAKLYRLSKKDFIFRTKESKSSGVKKAKIKVLK